MPREQHPTPPAVEKTCTNCGHPPPHSQYEYPCKGCDLSGAPVNWKPTPPAPTKIGLCACGESSLTQDHLAVCRLRTKPADEFCDKLKRMIVEQEKALGFPPDPPAPTADGEGGSMNAHTKGPWFCEGTDVFSTAAGYPAVIADTDIPQDEPTPSNGEKRANARLIAAAPELLEALEAVVGVMDFALNVGMLGGVPEGADGPRALAAAAIAKAKVAA